MGLNKLFSNYDKMISYEKETLKQLDKDCEEVEKLQGQFVEEFNGYITKRKNYVEYINNSLENQRYLSSQIKNTDLLIHSKLLLEQQQNEQLAKILNANKEQAKKKLANEKRKKVLMQEIEELREQKKRFDVIFNSNGNDSDFQNSLKFKELLDNLDTKKDLERGIYENELKIKDIEYKLKILNEEKETLLLATSQKGDNVLEFDDTTGDDFEGQSLTSMRDDLRKMDFEIDQKRREVGKKTQFISDLKTGILSLCVKNGVKSVDSNNFASKSTPVLGNLTAKLKVVRQYLSESEFKKLISGKLNVKRFMSSIQDEKPNQYELAKKFVSEDSDFNKSR